MTSSRFVLVLILMLLSVSPARGSNGEDLETSVAMMAKISGCWSPTFSPDGKRIAFVSNMNGVPQIWIVGSNGGWPQLVTALDDQVGEVQWSPDGSWLAFSLAPGGGMNEQIYLVRPDGTGLRRLTEGGKENNWLGFWSHDGRFLAIASNRRKGAAMDAYTIDAEKGEKKLVAENEGIGSLQDISRDGQTGLLYRMRSRGSNDLYLISMNSRKEQLLTEHEGPGSFGGVISPDGKIVYLYSNKDRDQIAFARIKIEANGNPGPIEVIAERKDAELDDFRMNQQGTVAALIWNVGGRNELSFIDLKTLNVTACSSNTGRNHR
ncbi:hypothetical protein L0222_13545 [bacterium]|nr:hypothetical protein [bacterium]